MTTQMQINLAIGELQGLHALIENDVKTGVCQHAHMTNIVAAQNVLARIDGLLRSLPTMAIAEPCPECGEDVCVCEFLLTFENNP